MKKLLSFAMALILGLCLTACRDGGLTAGDATDYVRGILDQTYLAVFEEDYLKRIGLTEEEARAGYEAGLEVEYQYFTRYFDMERDLLTEQTREAILALLADLYQQAGYQVKPAVKQETGYAVEVAVKPIDIIPEVAEEYMEAYCEAFAAEYAEVDLTALRAEEEEVFWLTYENDWAMGIVELFREHQSELGYLEEKNITVHVIPDENGVYTLSDDDFANLDAWILAYRN